MHKFLYGDEPLYRDLELWSALELDETRRRISRALEQGEINRTSGLGVFRNSAADTARGSFNGEWLQMELIPVKTGFQFNPTFNGRVISSEGGTAIIGKLRFDWGVEMGYLFFGAISFFFLLCILILITLLVPKVEVKGVGSLLAGFSMLGLLFVLLRHMTLNIAAFWRNQAHYLEEYLITIISP